MNKNILTTLLERHRNSFTITNLYLGNGYYNNRRSIFEYVNFVIIFLLDDLIDEINGDDRVETIKLNCSKISFLINMRVIPSYKDNSIYNYLVLNWSNILEAIKNYYFITELNSISFELLEDEFRFTKLTFSIKISFNLFKHFNTQYYDEKNHIQHVRDKALKNNNKIKLKKDFQDPKLYKKTDKQSLKNNSGKKNKIFQEKINKKESNTNNIDKTLNNINKALLEKESFKKRAKEAEFKRYIWDFFEGFKSFYKFIKFLREQDKEKHKNKYSDEDYLEGANPNYDF